MCWLPIRNRLHDNEDRGITMLNDMTDEILKERSEVLADAIRTARANLAAAMNGENYHLIKTLKAGHDSAIREYKKIEVIMAKRQAKLN